MTCVETQRPLRSKELKLYIERVGSYRLAAYIFRCYGRAYQEELDKTYALATWAYDRLSTFDRSQPGGAGEARIVLDDQQQQQP